MINGGTGYCKLMMDNDILENTELNVSSMEQGLNQDAVIKLDDNMVIDDLIMKDSENMFIV
jgi:hypothetical protein